MDPQRQEYPALLATLQPEQAVDVLNNRVALIGQINASIADFLQERRKIEERYAADLRRLARRPQQDMGAALGIFQMPWQRIISGTENLAQSHQTLASKIETDVEVPLRQYAIKNREMQGFNTIQGNFSSLARDLAKARDKADKLNAKGGRKALGASSSVEDASREWESQSPLVFEQLQSLDENRLNHLRDVLTQFQTHEVDQVERNRTSAESCLNALLNIETADEIKTFAVRVQQGNTTATRRSSVAASDARPPTSGSVPPMPPPPRTLDPRRQGSSRREELLVEDKASSTPEGTPHKSKMGGLKRLGTVMSRRKSAAPPPPQSSEKKKEKTRSIIPFRRGDSSRSFQDLEATGQDLTHITSQAERAASRHGAIPSEAPITEHQNNEGITNNTTATNGRREPDKNLTDDLPQPPLPTIQQPPEADTQVNTVSASRDDLFARASGESTTDLDGPARNLTIRDLPIREDAGEAQLAMHNMASQLRLQAQSSGMSRAQGSVRGRRDVRNTMFFPNNQELPGLSEAANGGLSAAADAQAGASTGSGILTAQIMGANAALNPMSTKRNVTGGSTLDEQTTTSDATSIHSAQSLATIAYHPELHEPGLNASIVETVNTWFSETGVTKSFVVGEIAFAHIGIANTTPQEQEAIRLQNFHILEKVAANPQFVTSYKPVDTSAEEQAGLYTVSLSAIRRSVPTVGLKYQLHLDDSSLANYSPILISPAWQLIPGQASVIVVYSLNPAFSPRSLAAGSFPGQITLKNVAISVNLDVKDPSAGKPVSAMMSPTQGASFRRKAGAVIWRFPELKVTSQQERLLVRFVTEGEVAKKGSIELKFEIPETTTSSLGVEKLGTSSIADTNPFADATIPSGSATSWTTIPTKRCLITGKYSAT